MWCIISNCCLFDLNNKFCELYNRTENLAVDKVIMLFKGSEPYPMALGIFLSGCVAVCSYAVATSDKDLGSSLVQ